jgi:5-methyltetrahydropteroyltriglutamate--homocysteine methyltransferase
VERALEGITGATTALHICFGYAAIIHDRPSGYSFLPELADTSCEQISIESAQSNLDLEVLDSLPGKTIILGVLDLGDERVETPETVADRIRRALPHKGKDELVAAPDCGMKYLPRDSAYGKLEALVAGAERVRDE